MTYDSQYTLDINTSCLITPTNIIDISAGTSSAQSTGHPSWLIFDPATYSYSGTAPLSDDGLTYTVIMTVNDGIYP